MSPGPWGLDMAGYNVTEAATVEEALHALDRKVDAVLMGMDLTHEQSAALLQGIRQRPVCTKLPVIGLVESGTYPGNQPDGVACCVSKFDREAMLESLGRLASALLPVPEQSTAGKDS